MPDADGNLTEEDYKKFINASDKEQLWWALYRTLSALASARAVDPHCKGQKNNRGGTYSVVHFTADHWAPQIPGMPDPNVVAREIAADDAYHEITYAAEARGQRVTGDEFI